ncbi:hypothetical protein HNR44_001089 [Geomicrobium halophilum]|uniref:YprB ribonuclease H-like domain-containing protein n=1 Tax=Geomicrobium halophilum TaxID=549000 RepID=A0A841PK31_9BACL|nr:ribonuclease H-like domain-containing protein [Geomicrobium halophilum]MBB6449140.1 hypothetical protein [Geomicrobium halophilum]
MDIQKKLQRLKPHLHRSQPEVKVSNQNTEPEMMWKDMEGEVLFFEDSYAFRKRRCYPLSYVHGGHAFKRLRTMVNTWKEAGIEEHPLAPGNNIDPEDLIFLDTETTGLSHGAGNMIFMIGTAQLCEDEMIVDQFFLPGPEHEIAFYHHFLMNKTSLHALVTYNGKAFDWPQLKTRHTLLREELPSLPAFGHFDLLHAARRLFKHELDSCRLKHVEREILGFTRQEDTPGYLAPMLYQDFLTEGDPAHVQGVFHHNEQDILSLITLYVELSERMLNGGMNAGEAYEVARWWRDTKHLHRANQVYATVDESSNYYERSLYERARLLKKIHHYQESLELFKNIWRRQGYWAPQAAEALAIWYEHQENDYVRANHYTKEGYSHLKYQHRIQRKNVSDAEHQAWKHRLQRLERKLEN